MHVKQIATFVNTATAEILGEQTILQEDLSNVVEVGRALENAQGIERFMRTLPDVIGRQIFVIRKYSGGAPNILMDGWEFGSILGKYRGKMPEATENESWELQDGQSYDPNIFTKPEASAKFYNGKTTFQIAMSFAEKQVKSAFLSADALNTFVSMIYNEIDKSMRVKLDGLVMRTINNMAAETIYDGVGTTYDNTSVRAVNLLKLYNDDHPAATLTQAQAPKNPDFIRYAISVIKKYREYMRGMSTRFNVGGTEKFTPVEMQKCVMLSDFASDASVYLYNGNGQFKTDALNFGEIETVPFWQASGSDYSFSTLSEIKVKTTGNHEIDCTGVLAVLFDRDACAVCNKDPRVTSTFNPAAEFYNNWYKQDAEYLNDFDENFVVFYIHKTPVQAD